MLNKKICMLGASGVGKTSLVKQYVSGIFSDKYLTTIGVKIDKKQVQVDEQTIQFMLWDIEGTDKYSGFNAKFLRGAAAYLIVVDVTRSQSLVDGNEIRELAGQASNAPAVLILNKSDLDPMVQLDEQQKEHLLSKYIGIIETSAKTGKNVDYAFEFLAQSLLNCAES